MPASRIPDDFLAYIRTGAYMLTLPPPDHSRVILPEGRWPSDADLAENLESHHRRAPMRGVAAIVDRCQPSHAGSVLGGVVST